MISLFIGKFHLGTYDVSHPDEAIRQYEKDQGESLADMGIKRNEVEVYERDNMP